MQAPPPRPLDHPPGNRHNAFHADPLNLLEHRVLGVDHALGNAKMVAQVDEQQLAMVAEAMDPARKTDHLADIFTAQVVAFVGTITMHG